MTETTNTSEKRELFRVSEYKIDWLRERIAELNKRAKRLGCPETGLTVEREEVCSVAHKRDTETGYARRLLAEGAPCPEGWTLSGEVVRFYHVRVIGEAPKLNGWTFVATLDHIAEVGTILRAVPGQEVPVRFREATPEHCDHCHTRRRRNSTYVLRHEDARYKQVGSTCLADFLGHADPAMLAGYAEILAAAGSAASCDDEFDFGGGHYMPRAWDLDAFLTWTAKSTREHGWTSRTKAREFEGLTATADDVMHNLTMTPRDPDYKDLEPPTADDAARAKTALEWAATLVERTDLNDYLYNCAVVVKAGIVIGKLAGIAASILPTAERELGTMRERAKVAATSKHVGTVGKRESFGRVTCDRIFDFESMYGVTHLHKFHDAAGNVLTWKASSERLTEGVVYALTGTVKEHAEYKGVAETHLSRCTAIEPWTCEECGKTDIEVYEHKHKKNKSADGRRYFCKKAARDAYDAEVAAAAAVAERKARELEWARKANIIPAAPESERAQ